MDNNRFNFTPDMNQKTCYRPKLKMIEKERKSW